MAVFRCRRCDYTSDALWEGRCPGCRGFYRAHKVGVDSADQKKQRSTFARAAEVKTDYIPTGLEGFDQTIGGGLVAGSPILLGGMRGVGKSTLLALIADAVAKTKGKSLFISSEQSADAVISIAQRLGLTNESVEVLGDQTTVERGLEVAKETKPFLTVWDSLQRFVSIFSGGGPGSAAQENAVADAILRHCRATKTCAIIVNQLDKAGEFKGGTGVAHAVDTVLMFMYANPEKDEEAPIDPDARVLFVDGKNRNGSENGKSYWKMTEAGTLVGIPPRSLLVDGSSRGKYRRRREDD